MRIIVVNVGIGCACGVNADFSVNYGKVCLYYRHIAAFVIFGADGDAVIARKQWPHLCVRQCKRIMCVIYSCVLTRLVVFDDNLIARGIDILIVK